LNTLAEVSSGLATCGCGPAEIANPEQQPAMASACCAD
jgi:hypothetical protein